MELVSTPLLPEGYKVPASRNESPSKRLRRLLAAWQSPRSCPFKSDARGLLDTSVNDYQADGFRHSGR